MLPSNPLVRFIDAFLRFAFGLWPWEVYILIPIVTEVLAKKSLKDPSAWPTQRSLITFNQNFFGVYAGLVPKSDSRLSAVAS